MQILFCVSPEEKKLIRRKMIESKTKNMGAYLRKMAIDGYIVNTDTSPNPPARTAFVTAGPWLSGTKLYSADGGWTSPYSLCSSPRGILPYRRQLLSL